MKINITWLKHITNFMIWFLYGEKYEKRIKIMRGMLKNIIWNGDRSHYSSVQYEGKTPQSMQPMDCNRMRCMFRHVHMNLFNMHNNNIWLLQRSMSIEQCASLRYVSISIYHDMSFIAQNKSTKSNTAVSFVLLPRRTHSVQANSTLSHAFVSLLCPVRILTTTWSR